jgi:hypothetical protein
LLKVTLVEKSSDDFARTYCENTVENEKDHVKEFAGALRRKRELTSRANH